MSADDGGSLDLDDVGSFDLDETEDQGSVGSDAFTTPLVQYKPHDDLLGLRQRRRTEAEQSSHHDLLKTSVDEEFEKFYSTEGIVGSDAFTPLLVPKYKPHMSDDLFDLFMPPACGGRGGGRGGACGSMSSGIENRVEIQGLRSRFRDDDYIDEFSQMISPLTVIARTDCNLNLGTSGHTEQIITPSSRLMMDTPHRTDIQEGNSNDEEVHGERKGLSKKQRITSSSLLPMNTPHRMDTQEGSSTDEEVHGTRKDWSQKMDFEWIFVITNIVLESISSIFTQLSSKKEPQYALFGMLLSYFALLTCIIELIYEGRRHQKIPIWRRRRGTWYYDRPQRRKSFATLNNIVALACALGQCVVTTINYRFENPIKVTVLPIILAFGVLFSKTFKYRQREAL